MENLFAWVEHAFKLSQTYPNCIQEIQEMHSCYQSLTNQVEATKTQVNALTESESTDLQAVLRAKASYDEILRSLETHEKRLLQKALESCFESLSAMFRSIEHYSLLEIQECAAWIDQIEKTVNETKSTLQTYPLFSDLEQLVDNIKARSMQN